MSGGHFNYTQYTISEIANEVEQLILTNDSDEKNEWGDTIGRHYSPETIEEFKKGRIILRQAYEYAQRIDWLVSGDDSEDWFHKRLKHDLENIPELYNGSTST